VKTKTKNFNHNTFSNWGVKTTVLHTDQF